MSSSSRAPTTSGSSEPHAPPHHKSPAKSEREHAKARAAADEEPANADAGANAAQTSSKAASANGDAQRFVELTAFMTAYMRAAESSRPDAIVHDPFAEELAGDAGAQLLATVSKWGPSWQERVGDLVAIRTRYLDEALRSRRNAVQQIVLLAAGMDARAVRLDALRGCRVFELDRSRELLGRKQEVLRAANAAPAAASVEYIVADLANDSWEHALRSHGFDPLAPTFWCMEGLLGYLDRSAITKVLKTLDALSAPGSELWADVVGTAALGGRFPGVTFAEDDPLGGMLSTIGWDLRLEASFGAPAKHFGREWEPLRLSDVGGGKGNSGDDADNAGDADNASDAVLDVFFVAGTKPKHRDVAPLL